MVIESLGGLCMDVRDGAWSEIELTVTVKAYPAISTKHRETVCVAGIREGLLGSANHIRLYPVDGDPLVGPVVVGVGRSR